MAQSAAAGGSAGIYFKSSVQRQPEDRSAGRVGAFNIVLLSQTDIRLTCSTLRNNSVWGSPAVSCRGKAWADEGSSLGPDRHARDILSLDRYAMERWEVILQFMVGSPGAAVSQDIALLLVQAGLMKRCTLIQVKNVCLFHVLIYNCI